MLRDLIKEGGLYTLANFFTKGISLLLIPFYTAYFTTNDYGIIDILTVLGILVSAFITLQLYQGVARYISEASISETDKKKISSSALWIVIIMSTAGIIVLSLLSYKIVPFLSTDTNISKYTFILAMLNAGISNIYQFNNVHLRFLRHTKSYALISILYGLLNIGFTILFVLVLDQGVNGYFYGFIIPYPIVIFIQFIILKKEIVFTISIPFLKKTLGYSLPLVPAALAYVILNFTDRLFINEYLGTSDVGIYGIASKFSMFVSIIILSISAALGPIVFERHLKPSAKKELERVLSLFFVGGSMLVLILSLFSYETIYIFTNENYYQAVTIMPILYFSIYVSGFSMFSIGLQIKEKTKIIGRFVLISALLNIVLNYLLITKFELYGAAFSTLISVIFNTVTLFFLSQKHYKLNFPLLKFLLVLIILALLIYFEIFFEKNYLTEYLHILGFKIVLIIIYLLFLQQSKLLKLILKK